MTWKMYEGSRGYPGNAKDTREAVNPPIPVGVNRHVRGLCPSCYCIEQGCQGVSQKHKKSTPGKSGREHSFTRFRVHFFRPRFWHFFKSGATKIRKSPLEKSGREHLFTHLSVHFFPGWICFFFRPKQKTLKINARKKWTRTLVYTLFRPLFPD